MEYYWVRLKGSYVVARIFFLLLLNCSAWPCLVLLSKTFKPFRPTQYIMNQQVWEGNGLPRLQPGRQHVAAALPPPHQPGWQFNSKKFGLSFSLKNHLSFGLRFPKLIESSNMGSLDMSIIQNGISCCFSSQNSSQTLF